MQSSLPIFFVVLTLVAVLLLWVVTQVMLTVGFIVLKKDIKTITPSFVVTGLAIAVTLISAVPYISSANMLKIFSISFLAYLVAAGYSYKTLKIKEMARYIR